MHNTLLRGENDSKQSDEFQATGSSSTVFAVNLILYTNYYLFPVFETVYYFLLYIRSLILFHDARLYRNFIFCLLYSISSDFRLRLRLGLRLHRLPLVGIDFEPTVV